MKKMLALMLVLGGMAIVTAGVNAWTMRSVNARYSVLVDHHLPSITQLVRGLRLSTDMVRSAYRTVTAAPGSVQARDAARNVDVDHRKALESFDHAVELNPELASRAGYYRATVSTAHQQLTDALRRGAGGQGAAALRDIAEADDRLAAFIKDSVKRNDVRMQAAARESAELSAAVQSNILWSLAISIVSTLAALLLAHRIISTTTVRPLLDLQDKMRVLADGDHRISIEGTDRKDEIGTMNRAVAVFRDRAEERAGLEAEKQRAQTEQERVVGTIGRHLDLLAGGDLTASIREEFPPSYAQVRDSFNAALTSLGALIRSVAESTAEIRTGSSEIAQASEDLARRTESNAASLEETSAAISQMDGRLKATAGAATETVGRADQAIATVGGGRGVADQAVQAMGRVSESAKGIDSVIEGLDKIAFQTRVLAMNAAVEAGRAGEAGRGFAVVADLVSALAMRAEEEAKRARDQLTVTQTDIVTAVEAVGEVDAALQNISADVGEVHQLLGRIASDNQAQATAITEINAAIASMDQSTQQNAAMVEETSAAARNLLSEVSGLAEQAGRFRCDGAAARAKVPATAPAVRPAAKLPTLGKEGVYQSPVKPLPAAAVKALTRSIEADWNEF
ncbi:methyl-accepting chemotaxis protein [Sphingomonas glaciei]|uniref:Methyl-accepting chemotaxis protein n=1 Tax=Sphingomonas glaciei TaxID=2938948 RepID=A0ABY5MT51_9SPHN|nr:HAMP domain-containing methyl-accepting chemotaxis protein [Sphingomonas glaciei]UUR06900.1 methyl-accepting chemotaxis protein [Sphingomonas glaciei]